MVSFPLVIVSHWGAESLKYSGLCMRQYDWMSFYRYPTQSQQKYIGVETSISEKTLLIYTYMQLVAAAMARKKKKVDTEKQ